jgi:hypothetical protein
VVVISRLYIRDRLAQSHNDLAQGRGAQSIEPRPALTQRFVPQRLTSVRRLALAVHISYYSTCS